MEKRNLLLVTATLARSSFVALFSPGDSKTDTILKLHCSNSRLRAKGKQRFGVKQSHGREHPLVWGVAPGVMCNYSSCLDKMDHHKISTELRELAAGVKEQVQLSAFVTCISLSILEVPC